MLPLPIIPTGTFGSFPLLPHLPAARNKAETADVPESLLPPHFLLRPSLLGKLSSEPRGGSEQAHQDRIRKGLDAFHEPTKHSP